MTGWETEDETLRRMVYAEIIQHERTVGALDPIIPDIARVARHLRERIRDGAMVFLCGNGGSAADAQHIAAELVVRYRADRPALPAVALTTDTSVLTAASNDIGFGEVFSRQVYALGRQGDVLIAISTSGRSVNVRNAVLAAAETGMSTVLMTGNDAPDLSCNFRLCVPSMKTARIQEMHILIGHILCEALERTY